MTNPPPPQYGNYGQPGPPQPQYGYAVPAPGYAWPSAADPLVTGVQEGFGGWFNRLFTVLGRSWKSLLLISWVTFGVPITAMGVVGIVADRRAVALGRAADSAHPATVHLAPIVTLLVVLFVVAIASGFLVALAQAATTWVVTRQAAGYPAPLGAALRYGLRNALRLWGWGLLYGLMVAGGFLACFLPAIYLALAGCLYVPVALYWRGLGPISTSFSLINRSFWPSFGRMAVLLLMVYGSQFVLAIPTEILAVASPTAGLVVSVVVELLTMPLVTVITVGSVLLFAELSNKQTPTSTAHLDAALGWSGARTGG